ncbi:MAG: zf-HC2 domain-containing protein [Gemmatimonadales bacterium]
MRMIPCQDVLARLWDYLDGELTPREANDVRRHLELCSKCYPHFDFQRAHAQFMRGLRERQAAPDALRRAVFAVLAEREP